MQLERQFLYPQVLTWDGKGETNIDGFQKGRNVRKKWSSEVICILYIYKNKCEILCVYLHSS